MKNKVLTYGLLAVVLGVWGYIIYRVVAATGDGGTPIVRTAPMVPAATEDLSYYEPKDSLSLSLTYRDPMWDGAVGHTDDNTVESDITTPVQAVHTVPVAKEPETRLAYLGFIENEDNKKKVAIVEIDGRQYMLGAQESREGVEVLRVEADFIAVRHKQKNKILYK